MTVGRKSPLTQARLLRVIAMRETILEERIKRLGIADVFLVFLQLREPV
jgi:hypothetical protein